MTALDAGGVRRALVALFLTLGGAALVAASDPGVTARAILGRDRYQTDLFVDGPQKVIILSRVLPMPSTLGYEELHHLRVTKVNGVELQSLADLPAALTKPQDGVHKIEFDSDPAMIFLDAAGLTADQETLVKNYRLPLTQRLEED